MSNFEVALLDQSHQVPRIKCAQSNYSSVSLSVLAECLEEVLDRCAFLDYGLQLWVIAKSLSPKLRRNRRLKAFVSRCERANEELAVAHA